MTGLKARDIELTVHLPQRGRIFLKHLYGTSGGFFGQGRYLAELGGSGCPAAGERKGTGTALLAEASHFIYAGYTRQCHISVDMDNF